MGLPKFLGSKLPISMVDFNPKPTRLPIIGSLPGGGVGNYSKIKGFLTVLCESNNIAICCSLAEKLIHEKVITRASPSRSLVLEVKWAISAVRVKRMSKGPKHWYAVRFWVKLNG